MHCEYCKKRLGIIQLLKGQSFCSAEHQELYFGLSFERLRQSVSEFTSNRPKPELVKAKPQPVRAQLEELRTQLLQPQAEPELAHAMQPQAQLAPPQTALVAELDTSLVAQQSSLAAAIASPVIVEKDTGTDPPEASFLHELPSVQDEPGPPLKRYAAEPMISAAVKLPVSPTPAGPTKEPPAQTSPSLALDVSPAKSTVEVTPAANQATWLFVPQGYPPVVVSAVATLVLDPNGADLIPLPLGEPCPGERPARHPQAEAIEIPLQKPRLPSWQADDQPASESSLLQRPPILDRPPTLDRPPVAAACGPAWKARLGLGPALPQLAGMLRPQRDLVRLAPPLRPESFGVLSSFPFFAEVLEIQVPPKQMLAAPAAHLPATMAPLRTPRAEKTPSTSRAWTRSGVPRTLAVEFSTPLRYELSSSHVTFAWLRIAVASQLPQSATILPPLGLSLAADRAPLGCSLASSFPPSVETAAVTSALPTLVLSRPLSTAESAMPLWSNTRPLTRQACRLPAPVSERQYALSAAYLHPFSPSPLSLVTWSRSLSISLPACNPSNLGRPASIGVSAIQGRPHALRPSSPSRRIYRLTPLLPRPEGVVWTPVAPVKTSLRPPAPNPIRPGSKGTAPPSLVAAGVQPASMLVLPPASEPSEGAQRVWRTPPSEAGTYPRRALFCASSLEAQRARRAPPNESGTGPRRAPFCASSLEGTLKMACCDVAHATAKTAGELRAESSTVLPPFSATSHAPAIGLAPGSHIAWRSMMPPPETVRAAQPFSALKPLTRSMTACLPGPAHPG